MRLFHAAFNIGHAPRDESSNSGQRLHIEIELSWTHYRLLTKVHQIEARRYYLTEAVAGRWSTRELERQIITRHFERGLAIPSGLAISVLQPVDHVSTAESVMRDPYVLEFLGLPDRLVSSEHELEQALMDQLQAFLLELGRGFSFVGQQQRITVDGDHFHIDLVFYNYTLRLRADRSEDRQA